MNDREGEVSFSKTSLSYLPLSWTYYAEVSVHSPWKTK